MKHFLIHISFAEFLKRVLPDATLAMPSAVPHQLNLWPIIQIGMILLHGALRKRKRNKITNAFHRNIPIII